MMVPLRKGQDPSHSDLCVSITDATQFRGSGLPTAPCKWQRVIVAMHMSIRMCTYTCVHTCLYTCVYTWLCPCRNTHLCTCVAAAHLIARHVEGLILSSYGLYGYGGPDHFEFATAQHLTATRPFVCLQGIVHSYVYRVSSSQKRCAATCGRQCRRSSLMSMRCVQTCVQTCLQTYALTCDGHVPHTVGKLAPRRSF